jgi:hypothetical protein
VKGFPQSEVDFSLEGGRINISSFLKGEDVSSWFIFDFAKVKGKVSEESLNDWLGHSNHQFKVRLKDGRLMLIWQKNGGDILIPGKLEVREGGIYFLPKASTLLQLYLGRKEIPVWERPEINFTSIHLEDKYLLWEGEISADVFRKKFKSLKKGKIRKVICLRFMRNLGEKKLLLSKLQRKISLHEVMFSDFSKECNEILSKS